MQSVENEETSESYYPMKEEAWLAISGSSMPSRNGWPEEYTESWA
jgi:hypothetical protein